MIPIRGDAAVGEDKLGFGKAGGEAFADHVMGAGVYALDVFVEVTISMTSRIKSSCWVLDSQLFGCQRFLLAIVGDPIALNLYISIRILSFAKDFLKMSVF